MRLPISLPAPTAWLRVNRRTARLRLTLMYSALFLICGTAVLALTYIVFSGAGPISNRVVQAVPQAGPVTRLLTTPLFGVQQQHNADVNRLLGVSWFVLAVAAVGSAPLGWFAAGWVLRPLRSITSTARTISAGNLHERLAMTGPEDEFKALGDTLDELLGRLEASFEAQRRFVANASHELRTPLTLERTLLQVALADPDASAERLRATCEEVLASAGEHERLLESLLTLASSERDLEHRERLDLSHLAAQVLDSQTSELERRSLRVERELDPAPVTGDPALLERLIANLIDNAVQHNHAGGRIEVRTGTDGDRALLSVANTGEEIAAGEVERLLEPFRRRRSDRTEPANSHHGLGLSIVRAIAIAHDAALTVRPQPGGGLQVTVSFQAIR